MLVPQEIRRNLRGHEIEYPVARLILGGFVTVTVLNLLPTPDALPVAGAIKPARE